MVTDCYGPDDVSCVQSWHWYGVGPAASETQTALAFIRTPAWGWRRLASSVAQYHVRSLSLSLSNGGEPVSLIRYQLCGVVKSEVWTNLFSSEERILRKYFFNKKTKPNTALVVLSAWAFLQTLRNRLAQPVKSVFSFWIVAWTRPNVSSNI